MKRIFEIEFPDDLGPMWMNKDNLLLTINAYCDNTDGKIKVKDITEEVRKARNTTTLTSFNEEFGIFH